MLFVSVAPFLDDLMSSISCVRCIGVGSVPAFYLVHVDDPLLLGLLYVLCWYLRWYFWQPMHEVCSQRSFLVIQDAVWGDFCRLLNACPICHGIFLLARWTVDDKVLFLFCGCQRSHRVPGSLHSDYGAVSTDKFGDHCLSDRAGCHVLLAILKMSLAPSRAGARRGDLRARHYVHYVMGPFPSWKMISSIYAGKTHCLPAHHRLLLSALDPLQLAVSIPEVAVDGRIVGVYSAALRMLACADHFWASRFVDYGSHLISKMEQKWLVCDITMIITWYAETILLPGHTSNIYHYNFSA
ncbi:hypothetical protein T4E_5763 [Trichinella pseudospiralis]|uniref:Uncharacterized protein n=1 Tax=Trichinella pseudospiralis TaxID=6337 RepID=A0A0V0XNL0_TRIPS|nr:hypothetical protein T4E_5763 [Trichinella pseudospiralis]